MTYNTSYGYDHPLVWACESIRRREKGHLLRFQRRCNLEGYHYIDETDKSKHVLFHSAEYNKNYRQGIKTQLENLTRSLWGLVSTIQGKKNLIEGECWVYYRRLQPMFPLEEDRNLNRHITCLISSNPRLQLLLDDIPKP